MFQREHTLDENPRGDHIFRVKVSKTHQTGDFNDGGFAAVAIMGPKLRAALRYTRLPQRSAWCALIRAKSALIG
ncbi:hypothetical protein UA70_19250 [Raoultella planticola]|nr:hypothetical protein UA70_19250 [Raoultella planticola]